MRERRILGKAQELWQVMIDPGNEFPISHDTYLKIWQLGAPVLNYDLVLVDEAQDTNPVMASVFNDYDGQIVFVGDEKQSIYAFRGAIDAMSDAAEYDVVESLYLTQSFRFGQAVAEVANKILTLSKKPFPEIKGWDAFRTEIGPILDGRYTVLCRSNAGAIEQCIELVENKLQPYFVGDIKELARLLDAAYDLSRGCRPDHPQIAQFASWTEYKECAQMSDDPEAKRIVKMISEEDVPEIVDMLYKASKVSESQADVIISTAHKSKGREWDRVILANDFRSLLVEKEQGGKKWKEFSGDEQELNLLYVAATRAQQKLALNETVREILEWLENK
jgi:superfamily I DNA/RNA helicase